MEESQATYPILPAATVSCHLKLGFCSDFVQHLYFDKSNFVMVLL